MIPAVCLILALDVSGSVSAEHYDLQRDATAAALESEAVLHAARAGLHVAAIMWGSDAHVVVDWQTDPRQAAARLRTVARPESGQTDMVGGMRRAVEMLAARDCERRVLDVSGDGRHNASPTRDVAEVVAEAVAAGVEINALPILTTSEPDLAEWFKEHVTGPAGGFVIQADWAGFGRAIKAKLALEVAAR